MKIEISQNANGVDVVTIDGLSVSAAVSMAILDAVDVVESLQHSEAIASWGRDSFMAYEPEDERGCHCGAPSCDGTCDTNVEHRRAMLDQEYSAGCVGCISGGCDECSEHNQFANEIPF